MDTLTGPLDGRAALVQILIVPALLTLSLVGFAIAMALAQSAAVEGWMVVALAGFEGDAADLAHDELARDMI